MARTPDVRKAQPQAPTASDAYVTDWEQGTVSVINLSTDTVTATIPAGKYVGTRPVPTIPGSGLAINPAGTLALVTDQSSGTVSVIDLSNDTILVGKRSERSGRRPDRNEGIRNQSRREHGVRVGSRVYPWPARPPARPTAIDGDHQATVAVSTTPTGWTPTSSTVTAADATDPGRGGQTCTVTGPTGSCRLTGLTNDDRYTATVTASNVAGTSDASPSSSPFTPADIALSLTGPGDTTARKGLVETVIVTNSGPSNATGVATNPYVPPGPRVRSRSHY